MDILFFFLTLGLYFFKSSVKSFLKSLIISIFVVFLYSSIVSVAHGELNLIQIYRELFVYIAKGIFFSALVIVCLCFLKNK